MSAATRPNVVIVTTHDTGCHFGCYGVDTVHTPAIDRLAADGFRADRYYASGAVCSPSRAAAMSGLYPQRNGVIGLVHEPWLWAYKDPTCHLSHHLRNAGYHTVLFHHQHEALNRNTLGFDLERAQEPDYPKDAMPDPYAHRSAGEVADLFTRWLKTEAPSDKPFYAQIGFFETHNPLDFGGVTPDTEKGVFVPSSLQHFPDQKGIKEKLAMLQGSVRKVDEAINVIYQSLEEQGVADNTLFVYTVDHGICFPKSKGYLYDSGLRVGLVMRWPGGGVKGGVVCRQLLNNVDLFPTILDLADAGMPEELDGRSFAAHTRDPDAPPIRDAVFAEMQAANTGREARAIRTERHKLIRNFTPTRLKELGPDHAYKTCPPVQLFDLEQDPDELQNLATDPACAEVRQVLDDNLHEWLTAVADPVLSGPVMTPYNRTALEDLHKDRAEVRGA